MKKYILLTFLLSFTALAGETGVTGNIESPEGCSNSVMVWLSLDKDNYKERLLLMHTQVPKKGSFQFYLKPGGYQLRASDDKGCEFFQPIVVEDKVKHYKIKMVKK